MASMTLALRGKQARLVNFRSQQQEKMGRLQSPRNYSASHRTLSFPTFQILRRRDRFAIGQQHSPLGLACHRVRAIILIITYMAASSDYFGWRKKQGKDLDRYPREEYRPPLALFNLEEDQEECPFPHKDKRWTAITYCFDSEAELEAFVALKSETPYFNWLYATVGEQPAPAIELEARKQIVDQESSFALPRKDFYTYLALYKRQVEDGMDELIRRQRTFFSPELDRLPTNLNKKRPPFNLKYTAERRLPVPDTLYRMDCQEAPNGDVQCRHIRLEERPQELSGFIPKPELSLEDETNKLIKMPQRKRECGPDREACYARRKYAEAHQIVPEPVIVGIEVEDLANVQDSNEYTGFLPAPPKKKYNKRIPYPSGELPTPHPLVSWKKKKDSYSWNSPQAVDDVHPQILPTEYELKDATKTSLQAPLQPRESLYVPLVQSGVDLENEVHPWSDGTRARMQKWREGAPTIVAVPITELDPINERVERLQEELKWDLSGLSDRGKRFNPLLLPQFMYGEAFVSPLSLVERKRLPKIKDIG
eukprot:Blabericola_migrator_1__5946@NODE_2_length_32877_cov_165_790003_g1_i0_p10_GENE_NODE_2_length_32877_cov_165_790003_g1_i0NODE_2_length_32877_cov_165_790003_g1_i0_p10_ORF_typecomplete_len537_score57_19_NODE_2_length_32877_cov_165_790003_g1_i03104732657